MDEQARQYDLILLGATGYTGAYTVEHILKQLPTTLKWAVAGRSAAKLNAIIEKTKPLNPDRYLPNVEVCTLDPAELDALAKKTTVLINAVGPYFKYSEPVVKACAENGTHYVDCTGEVPWVKRILERYEEAAKRSGAIIVPQSGFESAPPDLLAWSIVNYIRKTYNSPTGDLTNCVYELNSRAISGGTLATALGILSAFSLSEIRTSTAPYALAPTSGVPPPSASIFSLLTGLRFIAGLGWLTTSITSSTNTPIVQRSSILLNYGPKFRYQEYLRPSSRFWGVVAHWGLIFGGVALAIPPVRWLVGKLVYEPGQGPSVEGARGDHIELRGVGEQDGGRKKVQGRISWNGSAYDWTGVSMAVGAGELIRVARTRKEGKGKGEIESGFRTPAGLGEGFVAALERAGMVLEVGEV